MDDKETNTENKEVNEDEANFDLRALLPLVIAMIIIIVLFFKIVIPALVPTDHSPSRLIEETQDGEYFEKQVDRFR